MSQSMSNVRSGHSLPLQVGRVLNLAPVLALARELAALLIPARPRSEFRSRLQHELELEAQRRRAREILALQPWSYAPAYHHRPGPLSRRWVIGAAALGSAVSLAGAWYLVKRQERKAA